jgi:hypothetical protein
MRQHFVRRHPGPISSLCRSRAWSSKISWPCTQLDPCWSSSRRCW